MKKFEAPVFEAIDDFAMEPVYASSGTPDTPDKPSDDKWKITTSWRNHNSGSHSELAIIGVHAGSKSGEGITMNFICEGFELASVKDSSGYTVSNVSKNGFTIYRNGHFNPTERFEFNIQIVASDSHYHGAVGQTGQDCPARVYCTSYICNYS